MADDTTTNAQEQVSFGINDLIFTLQVYEAAAQRGAFRAEEMTNVGAVYDRLKAFLVANGAIPAPTAPAADAATPGDQQ
jgi:hypothetical protein